MNVIIAGPQACGKGTQARLLSEKYGWLHLEMGKILRSIANSDNQYAAKIHETMSSGGLVSDELVRLIAWDYIKRHHEQGLIFEGYPRSLAQYEHLQDMLKKFNKHIDAVISINIPEEESVKRMSDRRTCRRCGRVYIAGEVLKCECGGELMLREDDKPQAIRRRLQIYHEQTKPVFERAKSEGVAIEIDGMHPISEVHKTITKKLYPTYA